MTIIGLNLSKTLMNTIADFKFSIDSKSRESGVKLIECSMFDFSTLFQPVFIDFGFKIFKTYWKEFDIDKSSYPNKEIYRTLVGINSGVAMHYFHNSILPKITDILIDNILVGGEDYLYSFSDCVNYDSESRYISQYRDLYYKLTNEHELPTDKDKLISTELYGYKILRDISKASYYKIQDDKSLESYREDNIDHKIMAKILN